MRAYVCKQIQSINGSLLLKQATHVKEGEEKWPPRSHPHQSTIIMKMTL